MGCLYKLTSPANKSYIGITLKTFEQRWKKHLEQLESGRRNGVIYAAFRKYGPDRFSKEVLIYCDDWTTLCVMEVLAISVLKTLSPNGYNVSIGGDGVQGPRSEEFKRKVASAQKKRFSNPVERQKLRQAGMLGSMSISAKLAAYRRRKPKKPPMSREERSIKIKEAMAKPETREKVLECAANRAKSDEWRKKISESRKKAKHTRTAEWCKSISDKRKAEWADPEIRSKRLAALTKAREAKKLLKQGNVNT